MSVSVPYLSVQRVYFDDLDALNILHNVRYLLFIERARGELFNALGFHWQDDLTVNPDKFNVIAEHRIRYLAPVRGEGVLGVELAISHLGRTSMTITARVLSADGTVVHAEGDTRIVRLDPTTYRPCPWSEHLRAVVTPLLQPAPAAS
ncbi:acyl-CoA thioesterase [Chondromyces crocatus]|uniref:Thioesterase n=1 Tax=Chondromyces crocatus TaxID=52 RepID=A0A0K1ES73_CHOCO|nr:thioesterase family protein [Chondromyces crocatus]AKT43780.1 thioesterase [Chondromyces crocatus]